MVRSLGCSVDLQVEFDGVEFVDLVVDGWLVIECDSKLFHSEWSDQLKDYQARLDAAQHGCRVLRLTAEDIMYAPETVQAAIRGVVKSRRGAGRSLTDGWLSAEAMPLFTIQSRRRAAATIGLGSRTFRARTRIVWTEL